MGLPLPRRQVDPAALLPSRSSAVGLAVPRRQVDRAVGSREQREQTERVDHVVRVVALQPSPASAGLEVGYSSCRIGRSVVSGGVVVGHNVGGTVLQTLPH